MGKIREVKYLDNTVMCAFGENSNKKSSLNVQYMFLYMLYIATREYIFSEMKVQ